jgi:hypothetical protein
MADRFYKDIEVPDVTTSPPAPDAGFVQIYGRGGKLAYRASTGPEVILDLAPVQSVDGRTGAVTFLQTTRATEFVSTANNNTVQVAHTLVVPAARIVAGLTIKFEAWGTQTNAAVNGGNNNIILTVNGTAIATATVLVGLAAQTNRSWRAGGALTFRSTTQVVGALYHAITNILPVSATNAAAPTTIAAGNATIGIAVQTATAALGNTIRVGIAVLEEA